MTRSRWTPGKSTPTARNGSRRGRRSWSAERGPVAQRRSAWRSAARRLAARQPAARQPAARRLSARQPAARRLAARQSATGSPAVRYRTTPRWGRVAGWALVAAVPLAFLTVFFSWPVSALVLRGFVPEGALDLGGFTEVLADRKSTRLNSSHVATSYAVFCLKKKRHTIVTS